MEVELWNDKHEREMYENFAEFFAIIKATEKLEKAYVRDIILPTEYEPECQKLIGHFKTLASTLKDTVPSIERFHNTYKMDCPEWPFDYGSASNGGAQGGSGNGGNHFSFCCCRMCPELHNGDGLIKTEYGRG